MGTSIKDVEKLDIFRKMLRDEMIYKEYEELKKENSFLNKHISEESRKLPIMSFEEYYSKRSVMIESDQLKGDDKEAEIVKLLLKHSEGGEFIYPSFIFKTNEGYYHQLDILYISTGGVFIIEVKDWSGDYRVTKDGWEKYINNEWFKLNIKDTPTYQINKQCNAFKELLIKYNVESNFLYKIVLFNSSSFISNITTCVVKDNSELINVISFFKSKNRLITHHNNSLVYEVVNEVFNNKIDCM